MSFIVKKGSLSYFTTFAVPLYGVSGDRLKNQLQEIISQESLYDEVQQCAYNKNFEDNICECFNASDEFLKSGLDENHRFRFYIGQQEKSIVGLKKPIRIYFALSLFTYRNIGIITANIPISDLSVDDIIILKHRIAGLTTLLTEYMSSIADKLKDNEWFSKRVQKEYKRKYRSNVSVIIDDFKIKSPEILCHSIIEINDVKLTDETISAKKWAFENVNPLYGLLAGDEGYDYVPNNVVVDKIGKGWTTRSFFYIIAYGNHVLSVNFKKCTERGRLYQNFQKELLDKIKDNSSRIHFFTCQPCFPGLDTGVYKCIEKNIIIYFENAYIAKLDAISQLGFNKKRHKILEFIHKSNVSMTEINDLFSLISRESGTAQAIETIRYKTELQSQTKSLTNQSNNNRWIVSLTVFTIILGILAIQDGSYVFYPLDKDTVSSVIKLSSVYTISIIFLSVVVLIMVRRFNKRRHGGR